MTTERHWGLFRSSLTMPMIALAVLGLLWALNTGAGPAPGAGSSSTAAQEPSGYKTAVFAGGCFWCMEPPFDEVEGVAETTSGYTGGKERNPSYQQVASGRTGHTEALRVVYDPSKVSYEDLLAVFWRNHDPTTGDRQFCDYGQQYRPGIFYSGPEQQNAALASKKKWQDSGRFEQPIATEITELGAFYPAEDYHQDFYKKNPLRYKTYSFGCGRARRLEQLWGDS